MADLSAGDAGTVQIGSLTVNRIGLGTNRISENDESRSVLKRAIELGINFIDTAARYGKSEQVIGETLSPYPSGVITSTKGGWSDNNDPARLQESIDNSLKLLKLDQLPLWHLHRVAHSVPLDDTMHFLKTQLDSGKILHLGLSEVSVEQIEAARKIVPISSVQNHYNIADRHYDDVVDYCTKENIAFIPYYPLGNGNVVGYARVQVTANKYGKTSYQIALAWLLQRSPIILPIPGTLSEEHLESNIAASQIEFSEEDLKRLNQL